MANNYNEILSLVNAGNQMGLSNTIKRDYGIPLDFTSIQENYDAAVIYAATNTKAYVDQVIATEGIVYIITADSQGKYTIGENEYDVYLKKVGTAPVGDNVSVEVSEDGEVSIKGFSALTSAEVGYLPQVAKVVDVEADEANGVEEESHLEVKWVPVSAVVEGDGNTITKVVAGDESVTITSATEGDIVTYTVTANIPEVVHPEYSVTKTESEGSVTYQLTKDGTPVGEAIVVAEYDDTALANRVTAIENLNITETYATKTELNGVKETAEAAQTAEQVDDAIDAKITALDLSNTYEAKGAAATAAATAEQNAKDYADDILDQEIEGLQIAIEPDAESGNQLIVIKDLNNNVISSVDASKFVEDSFLDDVSYDAENGTINFTWTMGDGSTKTDSVAVADFVQTYTAGNGLTLTGNEFSIDENVVATVTALGEVDTKAQKGVDDAAAAQKTIDDYVTAHKDDYNNDAIDSAISGAIDDLGIGDYAKSADVVSNETFDQFKTDNTQAITNAREGAVSDVEAKGYAVASEVANTYVTKDDHATDLATKVDNGTIAHAVAAVEADPENGIEAVEGIPEGVTIDGTTMKIVVDAPTRSETIQLIADKVAQVTGGESAADVKLSLEAEVARSTAKDTAHDNALATLQGDANTSGSVAEAKALAQKGVDDAAAAKSAVDALTATNGQVTLNKNDIESLATRVGAVESTSATNSSDISTIKGDIQTLKTTDAGFTTSIENINTKIGQVEGNITNLETNYKAADAEIAGQISAINTTLAGKADQTAVDAVNNKIGTVEDGKTVVEMIEAAKTAATYDDTQVKADIAQNASDIAAIYSEAEDGSATGKLADEIARATAAEKALDDKIALLTENPSEELDSVIELINQVKQNGTEVAGIVTRLDGHDTLLAGIGGEDEPANVMAAITAAVDAGKYELAVATASTLGGVLSSDAVNEIAVADDGKMSVNTISVDKLVDGASELVLNGGTCAV